MGSSCIYSGWVMHRRIHPKRHHFRYRAWWIFIDLDELPALDAKLRFFSRGRFNLFSFYERDHGHDQEHGDGASDRPDMRADVEQRLALEGIDPGGGPMRLLCMPRVLGYQFNPLSIFFCHRPDGSLAALVYEVHNTYGERHSYAIAVAPADDALVRQSRKKGFYVSPFMQADLDYDFRVAPPADSVSVNISGSSSGRALIHAAMRGDRRPLTDGQLLRVFFAHPLVTLKVIGAIHWEALRLWRKGLRIYPHNSAASPAKGVTTRNSIERKHA
jgi:DUF1365 family protein